MKRIIAALFALIMCFALCACSGVKQEVYDAAMSSYETAKAGYEEVSAKYDELKSKVEKYSTVIDALEKEDYDGAVEAVNAMRPVPEVTEVEIAMDNLWDYFEITEVRNEQTDAQGNLKSLNIQNRLSLKEDYKLADRKEYPTDVAVGYEYERHEKQYWVHCTLDFENWTSDASASWRDNTHVSNMAHFPENPAMGSFSMAYLSGSVSDNENAIIYTIENFEILNASGTLYLVNK